MNLDTIVKIVVITYCLLNIFLNLIVLPRSNKKIMEDNKKILDRYERLDRLMDKMEEHLNRKTKEGDINGEN